MIKNKYLNKIKRAINAVKGLNLIENKIEVIEHLFGFSRKKAFYYKLKNGIILSVPNTKKDRTTILSIKEIFGGRMYPIESESNEIIIDLGAQAGIFSVYAAFKSKSSRIYAFEPDDDNFSQLVANVSLNSLTNRIFPFKKAISNTSDKVKFYKNPTSSRAHTMFDHGDHFTLVDSIKLSNLFSYLKIKKCDLLKMDIEGAEYEALYHCPQELLSKIGVLFVECHDLQNIDKRYKKDFMKEFLSSKGFDVISDKENVITAKNQ